MARFQSRRGLAFLAAVWMLVLAAPAYAQSASVMYERAQARERAARSDRDASAASLRAIAQSYESLVRKHPASGYADNSLWQAAGVMELAFARSGAADDRLRAERYLTWLRREYPRSSFVKEVPTRLAALSAATPSPPAETPAPAASRRPVPSVTTAPSGPAVIRAVTHSSLPRGDRLVIELSKEVDYLGNRVEGPDRVFFDFSQAIAASSLTERASKIAGGLITGLRFGRHANGTTRVVLELAGSPRYSSYALYNPFRVIIDVESSGPPPPAADAAPEVTANKPPPATQQTPRSSPGTSGDRERPARETAKPVPPPIPANATALPVANTTTIEGPPAPPPAPAPPTPAPAATTAKGDYSLARQLGLGVSRIVIDPGHGGHDPGARANGLNEADLVLDIAQRVATLLREQRGIDVVLTRDKNVFIPLEERTAIANRVGADLFVSIHANASRSTAASGVETYVLNFASNPAAEEVAARENATSGRSMGTLPELIQAIALNNKLQESRELATMVQTSLVRSLRTQTTSVRDLGVKQAPFVVLIGAQMPSVLAEVSFLTNRAEASQLKQPAYRQRIAQALHDAIMKYQASLRRITTN